jgi:hypothetical protein
MVLLPLSTFVFAQDDADEEEVEEVVTTGIKSSLKDAIDIKRKTLVLLTLYQLRILVSFLMETLLNL